MRAGPLSDPKVVEYINRHYVPVYVTNEDYAADGIAPEEEKRERNRIWRASVEAKMPSGTVHVYLLDSKANFVDSMHVAKATEKTALFALLKTTVLRLDTKPGEVLVAPCAQSFCPKHEEGRIALHLVARGFNKGSWRNFPGEDWIVLDEKESREFVPAKDMTWTIGK